MRYRDQFYNEGFGTTFYLKPINFINKKVTNKKVAKFISIIIKVLYTVICILFAIFMFILKFPL